MNKVALVAVLGLSLAICASTAAAEIERPNILVVLLDDAGFMDFGAYGSDTRTPSIDGLADQGAMFSRFYTSPQCGPSRAMLLTGMDNHQVGMGTLVETVTQELRQYPGYSMTWPDDQETIASLLSDAGYQTYVSGKWGIGETGANLPHRFGFDRSFVMDATGGSNYDNSHFLPGYHSADWFEDGAPVALPEDYYSSRTLVDRLISYIDGGDPEQPFFAFLSFQALHIPVQAPLEFIDGYNGVFDVGWDAMREARLQTAIELGLVPATTRLSQSPPNQRAWDDLPEAERAVAVRLMQLNAGMMEAADQHLGRLLDHLKGRGQLDKTMIIITSDNGPEAAVVGDEPGVAGVVMDAIRWLEGVDLSPGSIGQPGSISAIGPEWASVSAAPLSLYKFTAGEGGLRVPLVISGPRIAPSGMQGAPVHVADLVPTMLDAANVPFDRTRFYGRSLMPLLTGEAETIYEPQESFAFEVSGNAALYRGNWKIVRVSKPLGDSNWRLYDLSVDAGETTDLAAVHPALFKDMLNDYQLYSRHVGVIELGPEDYAVKQLANTVLVKVAKRYWPLFLAIFVALGALTFGVYRILRYARR